MVSGKIADRLDELLGLWYLAPVYSVESLGVANARYYSYMSGTGCLTGLCVDASDVGMFRKAAMPTQMILIFVGVSLCN